MTQEPPLHFSADAIPVVLLGGSLAVFLSGLLVNPWVGRLWRDDMVNYREEMLEYLIWAAAASVVLALCGWRVRKVPNGHVARVGLLLTVVLIIVVLPDRLLLARYGRRLFVSDRENIYAYRPNSVKTWGKELGRGTISINRYGLRDDDFPQSKPAGEFRILCLGDSVTMGHGVSHEETFCERLEVMLGRQRGEGGGCQVINAGVQGYTTWQELNLLRRFLVLQPDTVVLGFCLNDITEPFVSDKALGGTGVGYQGFHATASPVVGYFWSDMGYGRFVQSVLSRKQKLAAAKREETFNVARMSRAGSDDPAYRPAWDKTFADLKQIYDLAGKHGVRTVLVIFPYKFQILDRESRRPQKILSEHAKEAGIEVLDLLKAFDKAVETSRNAEEELNRYFLDEDHLSPDGHLLVASALYEVLSRGQHAVERIDEKGGL